MSSYTDTTQEVFDQALDAVKRRIAPLLYEKLRSALACGRFHDVDHVTSELMDAIKEMDEHAD